MGRHLVVGEPRSPSAKRTPCTEAQRPDCGLCLRNGEGCHVVGSVHRRGREACGGQLEVTARGPGIVSLGVWS